MKIIYLLIIIFYSCKNQDYVSAQSNECFKYFDLKPGREFDNLKGKVKSVKSYLKSERSQIEYLASFNEYTYSGKPKSIISYNINGNIINSIEYVYTDEEFVKEFTETKKSLVIKHYIMEHDKNGNVNHHKVYKNGTFTTDVFTTVDSTGNPVLVRSESNGDVAINEFQYIYNNEGLLTEEIVLNPDKSSNIFKSTEVNRKKQIYNSSGLLTEIIYTRFKNLYKRIVFNLEDNCLSKKTIYTGTTKEPEQVLYYNKDGTIRREEKTLKYYKLEIESKFKFDDKGNWIQREAFIGSLKDSDNINKQKNLTPSSSERREVEYF